MLKIGNILFFGLQVFFGVFCFVFSLKYKIKLLLQRVWRRRKQGEWELAVSFLKYPLYDHKAICIAAD